ncbi:hypothetical protein ACFL0V_06700 [Nanoarchaeota archaeon]
MPTGMPITALRVIDIIALLIVVAISVYSQVDIDSSASCDKTTNGSGKRSELNIPKINISHAMKNSSDGIPIYLTRLFIFDVLEQSFLVFEKLPG